MGIIDVRPDLAAEREPFTRILAVDKLASGEFLELIAPFEPVPLYRVMENREFERTTRRSEDSDWHVTFKFLTSTGDLSADDSQS